MNTLFSDIRAVTIRNLIRYRREPETILFGIIQPIMFVILFSQVFGGAINVEGGDYTDFLMAGIFAQTMVFGATISGAVMATDKKDGLLDRFRTLPMNPAAVPIGRTLADVVLNAISLLVMILTGLAVGWRPGNSLGSTLAGIGLLVLFSWSFSWVMVWLGMMVKNSETMSSASFIVLFPLTFLSNAFVPSETMPKYFRIFAEWNPVSSLVQAIRELFGNMGTAPVPDVWTLQNPILAVLLGCVFFVVVFAPLAIGKYAKAA
ncbi:MAG: ABC transporter permease [Corynebacterium sp.]|nr:ABC transporter permease [Corynebacterium sp.]